LTTRRQAPAIASVDAWISRRPSTTQQGIDNAEIIETVHARRAPMIPVSASLRL
jgi:hypothetical protein